MTCCNGSAECRKRITAHLSDDHLQGVIEVEDTATAHFRLPDGRAFQLFATTACTSDFPHSCS